MSATRVVVVDDHALFRSGVRAELDGHVDIVGDAASVVSTPGEGTEVELRIPRSTS